MSVLRYPMYVWSDGHHMHLWASSGIETPEYGGSR